MNILKNRRSFMQKTLKPTYFINEMHEYEFKNFSKTHEFNLDIPKTRFSTFFFFVPKNQSMNIFCIKIIEHIILDGQNKFTHIIMY